jgi:hypothetical protein
MKLKLSILCLSIIIAAINCNAYNHHKNRKKEKQHSNLVTLISLSLKNTPTVDCIYCDNTRAMNGNCTCYHSIPVASCTGMTTGEGKSNSNKISCSTLTSTGVWASRNDNTFYCNYTGCPPEAYRSAFTADGR